MRKLSVIEVDLHGEWVPLPNQVFAEREQAQDRLRQEGLQSGQRRIEDYVRESDIPKPESECPICQGSGILRIGRTCVTCNGSGKVERGPVSNNRFDAFNPDEREILRLLLNSHANLVSENALHMEGRNVFVASYLAVLEELEKEATGV